MIKEKQSESSSFGNHTVDYTRSVRINWARVRAQVNAYKKALAI